MKTRQVRRERPSLKTAHRFFSDGGYSIDPDRHFLSEAERQLEIKKIHTELSNLISLQFPKSHNLEYALLKAHLIIEHAITHYIRSFSVVYTEANSLRFSFSQKIEIAYLLGFGANDPILLPTVEGLNRLRNE